MKKLPLIVLLTVCVSILTAEVKEIKKNIPTKDTQTIELLGFNGSEIAVKTWNKNEVFINVTIDYSLSDREQEKEKLQQFDIVQEQIGERIIVRFKEPTNVNYGFSFKNFFSSLFSTTYSQLNVKGEIFVPSTANLTSDMRYGTYSVDGIKGQLRLSGISNTLTVTNCSSVQMIENNYGTTTINQSGGNLAFEGNSSTLVVNHFKGTVNADANYSTVTMNGISSDTKVICSSGRVNIDSIGGNIMLDVSYSTIALNNIKGFVTVESNSGTIGVNNTNGVNITAPYSNITIETVNGSGKPVYVQNSSGKITISGVTRDVMIDDSYSKLNVTNIQGNVSINGNGSSFTGKKINGNFIMKNEYGDIRVSELSASVVEVKNKNNKVDIDLLTKPTKIDILNEYGPVYISFPDYSGDVRLKASYATIKTNLPIEVEKIGDGAIAFGKVGSGSGMMNIKTESGAIEVHQNK